MQKDVRENETVPLWLLDTIHKYVDQRNGGVGVVDTSMSVIPVKCLSKLYT